jgi:hypothetical protein
MIAFTSSRSNTLAHKRFFLTCFVTLLAFQPFSQSTDEKLPEFQASATAEQKIWGISLKHKAEQGDPEAEFEENWGQTERSPIFRRMETGERPVCPRVSIFNVSDRV